jgi:hypothetical protein
MVPQGRPMRKDSWGKTPKDPFMRKLMEDPERAARISRAFTIGMILFWIFFTAGLLFAIYLMVFD